MPETVESYKRLPGTGYRREGNALITFRRSTSRLWLGSDHLLCAERSWWTEGYKRFGYGDIQAIIVRRTKRRLVINTVAGFLALSCGIFALLCGPVWRWVWGVVVAALGMVIAINSALGPACVAHLQTAVQLEELPAWRRVRTAGRGIAQLRQRIIEAQGEGMPAEAEAGGDEGQDLRFDTPVVRLFSTPLAHPINPYKGRAHGIMFGVIIVEGLVVLLRIPFNSLTMVILNLVATTAAIGAVVWALIRQHETDLRAALRQITWVVAVVTGLEVLEGYIGLIRFSVTHPQMAGNQWLLWKAMGNANPLDHTWDLVLLLVLGAAKAGLGAAGLLLNPRPTIPPPLPVGPPPIPPGL